MIQEQRQRVQTSRNLLQLASPPHPAMRRAQVRITVSRPPAPTQLLPTPRLRIPHKTQRRGQSLPTAAPTTESIFRPALGSPSICPEEAALAAILGEAAMHERFFRRYGGKTLHWTTRLLPALSNRPRKSGTR